MKNIFKSVVIAGLILVSSCGKDKDEDVNEQLEDMANQQEQTPLEVNTVSNNVIIQGATKIEGMPPTPKGAISIDISGTSEIAILNEGFDIKLSSDTDIIGAYIQFKANDGTLADSYYDINIAANSASNKSSKFVKGLTVKRKNINTLLTKIEDDITLDIDFNTNIVPGSFCYDIYGYDDDGNISEVVKGCVIVENWGGNAALVGEWNQVKDISTYDGEIETILVGEEYCDMNIITCNNQESLEYEECETVVSAKMIFKADGTFLYKSDQDRNNLDYLASIESCSAIYEDGIEYIDDFNGFWLYAEQESRLALVQYSRSETSNGVVSDSETYEEGDAVLLFDGVIELDGSELIITNEEFGDIFTIHFEK